MSRAAGDGTSGSLDPVWSQRPDISAVLAALSYFDVFNWPLSASEIQLRSPHRVSLEQVTSALEELTSAALVARTGDWFALDNAPAHADRRHQRERASEAIWRDAWRYGRWAGRVPFVRLVAVSGSLSFNAADCGDDIDLFIVAESGRVWIARAGLGVVVRTVRVVTRGRVTLCPNFVVGTTSMEIPDHDRCTAHDIVRLVAITDPATLARFRSVNSWTEQLLPNICGDALHDAPARVGLIRRPIETLLRLRVFDPLERAERRRRTRDFGPSTPETRLTDDCCKGHVDGHRTRILDAYVARLNDFGLLDPSALVGGTDPHDSLRQTPERAR